MEGAQKKGLNVATWPMRRIGRMWVIELTIIDYCKLAIFRTGWYHETVDNSAMQCCIVYHVPTI